MAEERLCECFGDSGLHVSTHGSRDGKRHCDICGRPVQPGATDVLTAMNALGSHFERSDPEQKKPMPDAPFQTCPTCGTPKIEGSHALVLYFRNDADREEFAAVVKAEMPNATAYPVGPVCEADDG